ncbi:hypothetical protein JCM5353_006750 [Sporobolomyces roseus]
MPYTWEEYAKPANDRHKEAMEKFTKYLDDTVSDARRSGLSTPRVAAIQEWVDTMKRHLFLTRTGKYHQAHMAILKPETEEMAFVAIETLKTAMALQDQVFESNGTELLPQYQASTIISFLNDQLQPSPSTQHSLAHFSRINGRHARILGVETGREANGGGYWLN